MTKIMRI